MGAKKIRNFNVAKDAIRLVIEYETKRKRKPDDVSGKKEEIGYDVSSKGRKIEVKGLSERNPFVKFNDYNMQALKKHKNFYLYVVYDIATKPKLIIYDRMELTQKIREARIHLDFEIQLRKIDWDKGKAV